jgi:adenylate kinase
VGKTTVVTRVAEEGEDLTVVNFGERVLVMALKEGLVRTPQEINLLRPEILAKLQQKAAEHIQGLTGTIILDMHLTVQTPRGFVAGMPTDLMNILKPSQIILLEANPDTIMKRRMMGKGIDTEESIKDIQERADFDRAAAISIAIDMGTPIKLVKNNDVDEAAQEITRLIDDAGPCA